MQNSIVVPLDGSDFANRALPVAHLMAQASHAPMRIVGVAHADDELPWIFDHVHAAARSYNNGSEPTVDIVIDPDPVKVMLNVAEEPGAMLCFASHDRPRFATKVLHSVGSELMARATRPYVVVGEGPVPESRARARDVVLAVDGRNDPEPLLAAAARWAAQLQAQLRIVTVYEPVLADLRRPAHYTRRHGPDGDPEQYLEAITREAARFGVRSGITAAIPDPISPAAGLEAHFAAHPARLVVVGGSRRRHAHPIGGTVRSLLLSVGTPLLVVNAS